MFQPDPWVIPTIGAIIGGLVAFIIYKVVRSHRRQPTIGREEFKGKLATVRTALRPEGLVMYRGEMWTAVIDKGEAKPGEEVIITRVEGLKLYVKKKEKGR